VDPDMFENYIAFDPSLWWNNHYWIRMTRNHKAAFPEKPKKLWFAGSHTDGISEFTRQLASMIKERAPQGLKWNYSDEPGETHATIFRATKEEALVWTLD